jgi:hypothetical protein
MALIVEKQQALALSTSAQRYQSPISKRLKPQLIIFDFETEVQLLRV